MITSTSNHQVKTIVQLNKKTKARRELRAFIVEGPKMVAETPRALLERVYVSEHFANEPEGQALCAHLGIDYEVVSDGVFSHMSDTNTPQGILAVVRMPEYTFSDLVRGAAVRLLVLEDCMATGCVGQRIAAILAQERMEPRCLTLKNLGGRFAPQGTVDQLYKAFGLDARSVAHSVEEMLHEQ